MSEEKNLRAREIEELLLPFCKRYFDEELTQFAFDLVDKLRRKRTLSILRGKPEIWAAAVVYEIARLNFLFDKANPYYLTTDTICDFFGTKKTTTGNKASFIEKSCRIRMGDPEFCRWEIAENFTFIQDEFGFVYPLSFVRRQVEEQLMTDEQKEERRRAVEKEKKRQEEERRKKREKEAEERTQKKREEFEKKHKNQMKLF